jgi:hypothetical protein
MDSVIGVALIGANLRSLGDFGQCNDSTVALSVARLSDERAVTDLNATAFGMPPIDFQLIDGLQNAVFARIATEGPVSARTRIPGIRRKFVTRACHDESPTLAIQIEQLTGG